MTVSCEEAVRRVREVANRTWGYPTATDELVVFGPWAESESAWVFTYNTRAFVVSKDIMRAVGVGNGPVVVTKDGGVVYLMPSGFGAHEALHAFESRRDT